MADLSFACGQVRALQSKLLDINRLERMIEAPTAEDAFRVLVELQYSEYFDESTTVKDFDRIIEQGLLETKKLLCGGTQEDEGMQFIWRRFDLNNLKRVLKLKLVEKKKELVFTEENGFSVLGNLTKEDIEKYFFEGKIATNLPAAFRNVLASAEEILQKHDNEFRFVEFALDRAYFTICSKIAETNNSSFLSELLQLWINAANVRNLARSILITKEKLPAEAWNEGGSYSFADAEKVENFADFQRFASRTEFTDIIADLDDSASEEENLLKLEKRIDRQVGDLLHNATQGGEVDIAVPLAYFERRLRNARMIKFVMAAKFHGLSFDAIHEALKSY